MFIFFSISAHKWKQTTLGRDHLIPSHLCLASDTGTLLVLDTHTPWNGSLHPRPYPHICYCCSYASRLNCSHKRSLKLVCPNKLCKRSLSAWPFWTERGSATALNLRKAIWGPWGWAEGYWSQERVHTSNTRCLPREEVGNIKKKVSECLIIKYLFPKKCRSLYAKKTPQNLSHRTLMSCLKIHPNVGTRRYHINLLF